MTDKPCNLKHDGMGIVWCETHQLELRTASDLLEHIEPMLGRDEE